MAITNYQLQTSSPQAIYISTGSSAITTMYLCNTSVNPITVNVFVVPSGFTAGPTNMIYSNLVIASNDTYVMEAERILLDSGDYIAGNSSVNTGLIATVIYTGI